MKLKYVVSSILKINLDPFNDPVVWVLWINLFLSILFLLCIFVMLCCYLNIVLYACLTTLLFVTDGEANYEQCSKGVPVESWPVRICSFWCIYWRSKRRNIYWRPKSPFLYAVFNIINWLTISESGFSCERTVQWLVLLSLHVWTSVLPNIIGCFIKFKDCFLAIHMVIGEYIYRAFKFRLMIITLFTYTQTEILF